jgi:hypothetical protein
MKLRLPDALVLEVAKVVTRLGLGGIKPIRRLVSRALINQFGYATSLRPRALSLASDYTSWLSLTDRTFSGRHLPPSTAAQQAALPAEADVVALYRRERLTPATDTSVMFMFFAQWFTDSFLRTSLTDYRKNESNHEIDLCQIYGRSIDATNLLRSRQGGRLKSQAVLRRGARRARHLAADVIRRQRPVLRGLANPWRRPPRLRRALSCGSMWRWAAVFWCLYRERIQPEPLASASESCLVRGGVG